MKGIILSGGRGTRLHPLTIAMSKQMLPLYDKPMIYYPLSTLMLAGIQDMLLISSPEHLPLFESLLGDGHLWGLNIAYCEQSEPRGLADALLVGEDFIGDDKVCLVLGDNVFFGHGLPEILRQAVNLGDGAVIFGYPVKDPSRYGVIEVSESGEVISIEEKPAHPRSRLAVPGIYFYDQQAVEMARNLKPSDRGELEITDLHRQYLRQGQLQAMLLGRGIAWVDAGTHESLMQAANFIQAVQERQGLMIACPEEIAFRMKYIGASQLEMLISELGESSYRDYLRALVEEDPFSGALQGLE